MLDEGDLPLSLLPRPHDGVRAFIQVRESLFLECTALSPSELEWSTRGVNRPGLIRSCVY